MGNKQKAIEKAYGEHWETVKDYVDENGWCVSRKKIGFEKIKESIQIHTNASNTYYWRPKSLQGIETNNGWIKIESEEDLPKENGSFFVYCKTNYYPFYRIDIFTGRLYNSFQDGKSFFTHYQQIIKPKRPIY